MGREQVFVAFPLKFYFMGELVRSREISYDSGCLVSVPQEWVESIIIASFKGESVRIGACILRVYACVRQWSKFLLNKLTREICPRVI